MSDMTMRVRGADVPVTVIPEDSKDTIHRGQFYAELGDDSMFSPTWDGLREKLYAATDADAVPVEFVLLRGSGDGGTWFADGTTRRLHSSQHNAVLVTWADGGKGTLDYHTRGRVLRPMPADLRAELEDKLTQRAALSARISEIVGPYNMDLAESVRKAKAASVQALVPAERE